MLVGKSSSENFHFGKLPEKCSTHIFPKRKMLRNLNLAALYLLPLSKMARKAQDVRGKMFF